MTTETIEEPQTLEAWLKKYGYSGVLSAAGAFGVAIVSPGQGAQQSPSRDVALEFVQACG